MEADWRMRDRDRIRRKGSNLLYVRIGVYSLTRIESVPRNLHRLLAGTENREPGFEVDSLT